MWTIWSSFQIDCSGKLPSLTRLTGIEMKRPRGRRVTFRIRKAMFALLRELAGSMDSSLASLCQVLIVIGSIFEYVRFEDDEHLKRFATAAREIKLATEVDGENPLKGALTSLARTDSILVSGRRRNRPHIEGTELVKVRLPSTFLRRIDIYARLTAASRSAILTRFFERGLFVYMRSQRALMTAVVESMRAHKPSTAHQHSGVGKSK